MCPGHTLHLIKFDDVEKTPPGGIRLNYFFLFFIDDELERRNFSAASDALSDIWSKTTIDGFKVRIVFNLF